MPWFDVGVNLTDKRLSDPKVVNQAIQVNVTRIAITGTDIESSEMASELTKAFPTNLLSTAGVHPHYSKDVSENFIEQLRALTNFPHVVAIGECGLDFNRNFSPREVQLEVFEQQLALASDVSLPVFLHERDAFSEQYALLEQYAEKLPGGIVHCFTGTLEQMQAYLSLGFYIGITGWVMDEKRGESLRHAVKHLPLSKIVMETDAPYLLPKHLRTPQNKRDNYPHNLPEIGQFVAELMDIPLIEFEQACWENACRAFQLTHEGTIRAV